MTLDDARTAVAMSLVVECGDADGAGMLLLLFLGKTHCYKIGNSVLSLKTPLRYIIVVLLVAQSHACDQTTSSQSDILMSRRLYTR